MRIDFVLEACRSDPIRLSKQLPGVQTLFFVGAPSHLAVLTWVCDTCCALYGKSRWVPYVGCAFKTFLLLFIRKWNLVSSRTLNAHPIVPRFRAFLHSWRLPEQCADLDIHESFS